MLRRLGKKVDHTKDTVEAYMELCYCNCNCIPKVVKAEDRLSLDTAIMG